MPQVSVLIPLYKTEVSQLREAIQSILDQTFGDFELLLLDDCPEDNRSAEVAAFNDPRIRYEINERNMGITPARNKLLAMAKGEYIAVMDHDDVSLPTRLEKQVAYLDAHPEIGVVSCAAKIIGTDRVLMHPEKDAAIRIALMGYCSVIHSACMIRRSVLEEHGLQYDADFFPCEDYALFCDLIPHTRFYNIPEPLFCYRDHEGNTSHKMEAKMREATDTIMQQTHMYNPTLYESFRRSTKDITRIKLFGLIPLLKIVAYNNRETGYLFGAIPLWKKRVKSYLPSQR